MVLDDQDALATDGLGIVHEEGRGPFDDGRLRVQPAQGLTHLDHVLGIGRVHFVDDEHVCQSHVGLARVISIFMSRAVRVRDNDLQIRDIKGEVIITAVPQDNVRFLFRLAEDLFIIHAGIDEHAIVDVRLVFLTLFDRGLMLVEVIIIGEALDFLAHQVSIWHRVTDRRDLVTHVPEDQRHAPRRLAFPRPRAHGANGHHWLCRFDLRVASSHQAEVSPRRRDGRGFVHHVFMRHIAVGKHNLLHIVLLDQFDKLLLGADGDATGVQLPGQLSRIKPSLDVGDLGRGERHDLIVLVAAKERVEVVEVTSCRAHDESFDRHRVLLFIKPH